LPLGQLINFGAPLLKKGLKRIVNNHTSSHPHASVCISRRWITVNSKNFAPSREWIYKDIHI
ncbi:MAG: hypothetical protein V1816_00405, partial [Pseudomonadota bacterium]